MLEWLDKIILSGLKLELKQGGIHEQEGIS